MHETYHRSLLWRFDDLNEDTPFFNFFCRYAEACRQEQAGIACRVSVDLLSTHSDC
jgi:hypothetical protein